jgi:hypothetical protein
MYDISLQVISYVYDIMFTMHFIMSMISWMISCLNLAYHALSHKFRCSLHNLPQGRSSQARASYVSHGWSYYTLHSWQMTPRVRVRWSKHLRKRLPGACLAATSAHTRPKLWRVLKDEYPSTLCHCSDGWCHCVCDLPWYWASAPAGEKEHDIMNYFIYCIVHDIMQ